MNEDIYQDKYKATVPKIIDYGCIFMTVFLFLFFAALHFHFFWCSPILLFVPFILSRFPGKIYCNENTVVIQDLYHGRKIIPIREIKSVEITAFAHKEGTFAMLLVHHYIFEMKIITGQKKYKFKMDAKNDIIEYDFPGYIDIDRCKNKVAFLRLKKYIETTQYIDNL